jgi:hypothetical protein
MESSCYRCYHGGSTPNAKIILNRILGYVGLAKMNDTRTQLCSHECSVREYGMKRVFTLPGFGITAGPDFRDESRMKAFVRLGRIEKDHGKEGCKYYNGAASE